MLSENNVILTKGIDGILSSKYFKSAVDKLGNNLLWHDINIIILNISC